MIERQILKSYLFDAFHNVVLQINIKFLNPGDEQFFIRTLHCCTKEKQDQKLHGFQTLPCFWCLSQAYTFWDHQECHAKLFFIQTLHIFDDGIKVLHST